MVSYKDILSKLFVRALFPFLWFYERYIKYRLREAWGIVHARNINNKGSNVRITGYSRFLDVENLKIGDNVRIGYNCFFFCKGGIDIGSDTQISRNVTIYSCNHDFHSSVVPYDNTYKCKSVIIGRGVWIGMNVNIAPGTIIGDGAIIGMGASIAGVIQAGEVVVNSKLRIVGNRDMDEFDKAIAQGQTFSKLFPDS